MLGEGAYVVAFSYLMQPKGKASVRTQISASLSDEDIDFAMKAFGKVKPIISL